MKELIKRLLYRNKYNSKTYIKYLCSLGMKIGEGTVIFAPNNTCIDQTRPWLISIGKNVQITSGVTILTHGYDWSVLKGVYGEVLGSSGAVNIGDNVFIGMNSTILKGVSIGNNVIIGANSLVNKNVPNDVVVAGNPAKIIMSLEDYYKKRKECQIKEATEMVRLYRERYGKEPTSKELREFFFLFENGTHELDPEFTAVMKLAGNEKKSYKMLQNNTIDYKNMDDFLKSI